MAKDKFKQMQQGGGALGSFQDMVQQAATVAAIEKQAEPAVQQPASGKGGDKTSPPASQQTVQEAVRFMRLPNPQIPITEYNLVTRYCEQFTNMTRQDFVELAIIEKLYNHCGMSQDDFDLRHDEIRNRPSRGHRKNTKTK